MLDLISKGGPLVWLLLGCFGLSLAIFLERLSYYHRAGLNIGEFLAGLASLIRRKSYAEALQECVATRVPAGEKAALRPWPWPPGVKARTCVAPALSGLLEKPVRLVRVLVTVPDDVMATLRR